MKNVFITGGSGTVGSSFIENFRGKYKFFSYNRNEKMQVSLKRNFPEVEIILGAVEDKIALMTNIHKCKPDIVIHAAAMKHVDSAEKSPIGAVKSNVIGSLNLIEACIDAKVPNTLAISTDKACSPDSTYGQTKYLMEQMFLEAHTEKLKFNVARFGNVAYSHGSVIPFWLGLKLQNKPLPLTDIKMNRLILSKNEAAILIAEALGRAEKDSEPFILTQFMKTVNMHRLAETISKNIEVVGLREGEKLNETLVSISELDRTFIEDNYILIRKFQNKGSNRLKQIISSEFAIPMSEEEILNLVDDTTEVMQKNAIETKSY
jgi:UDP-N-acetylglucosamine 4,6-dehydratase/5-epimerase